MTLGAREHTKLFVLFRLVFTQVHFSTVDSQGKTFLIPSNYVTQKMLRLVDKTQPISQGLAQCYHAGVTCAR